jgi:hypothetical protein
MRQPYTNLVDAVSGEEVCPLCFDRYSGADACTCVVCQVASCPSCAELLDVGGLARELVADGAVRCFACRPAPEAAAWERELEKPPLSLPRPIQLAAPVQVPVGLPALPFPLTTSPRGVRVLKPRAPGTVFVGLPPIAPALSESLSGSRAALPASTRAGASARQLTDQFQRLARRARQKLLLLTRLVTLAMTIGARAKPLLARLRQEGAAFYARLPGYRGLALARLGALRRLAHAWQSAARSRLSAALVALAARLTALRTRLAPQVRALRTQLGEQLARLPLLVRGPARFDQPVAKPKVDPSRPIHL